MNLQELITSKTNYLKNNNIEDSNIIVKELLKNVLNVDNSYLVIHGNEEISSDLNQKLDVFLEKIISGIPLQYITNKQEFMKLVFFVDENVLIPQPDTEILVEKVLNLINNKKIKTSSKIRILDLCTGSGAIAISLDKYKNKENENEIKIYASDISSKVLEVAKKNNDSNDCNVKFIKSDLFEDIDIKDNDLFDIIVSNPPYIKTDIIKTLPKDVQAEPILALDGGQDGLDFYKKIIVNAYKYIKNDGYLCLEIGFDQANQVKALLEEASFYNEIEIIKDLSGNDRCVICKVKK